MMNMTDVEGHHRWRMVRHLIYQMFHVFKLRTLSFVTRMTSLQRVQHHPEQE